MYSSAIALIGALVYGAADFLGGLAAQRLRSIVVTAVAAFTGLLLLLLAYPVNAATAVTTMDRSRFAASPPRKSAAP